MALTNTDYIRIHKEYDSRQLKNHQITQMRKDEVYAKIPEYRDLCERIADLSLRHATLLLETDSAPAPSYFEEMDALSARKKELLVRSGFPADYLEPLYDCPDCKDTGMINGKKCHCFERAIVSDLLYGQSGLSKVLEDDCFSNFDLSYYRDDMVDENTNLTPAANMKKVLDICMDFTRNFDTHYDNLIFYGRTGVGKTFLSHCIAKELLDTSHTVVYLTSLQLFDILEKHKFDKNEYGSQLLVQLPYIMNCELLIVDDLGTELTNSFTSSSLYYLMESRDAAKHSTIFSTNLSFDELRQRYSERIFSRFMNYTFLKILGDDIRKLKALRK